MWINVYFCVRIYTCIHMYTYISVCFIETQNNIWRVDEASGIPQYLSNIVSNFILSELFHFCSFLKSYTGIDHWLDCFSETDCKAVFQSTSISKSRWFCFDQIRVVNIHLVSALMRQNNTQLWMRQRNSDCPQQNYFWY